MTKSFGRRPLFRDITLGIAEGERIGLIGPNGAGKSTFLRIVAGLEPPDGGVVSPRRGLRVGHVAQSDVFEPGATVRSSLLAALASSGLDDHEKERHAAVLCSRLAFADTDAAVATLSGGWRKRLAIARELIREPDLLLLDEPTNHLDLEGILWLEELCEEAPFGLVVVTHDRYFLENVPTRVVEMSRSYAEGFLSVNGPYSAFLEERALRLSAQAHQQDALAVQVRREVEWLRRNPQARTTKAEGRIREAGRKIGDLEELRYRNNQGKQVDIDFSASGRKTRELLVGRGLAKSLGGRRLFAGLDVMLAPGAKLGIIGVNGSGKTTLLRILTGELPPDAGSVSLAPDLRVVYFDQSRSALDLSVSLRSALCPNGDNVLYRGKPMHVTAWAKRFLFRPEQLEVPVGTLSGGEQARVLIANLMLRPADVLILDEPTNDLDIDSLEVLEESLIDFPGALVLVSHDRFMLDRVCDRLLALDGSGGAVYLADYSQWDRLRAPDPVADRRPQPAAKPPTGPRPSSGLAASERKELGRMEEAILEAEAEVERLKARLTDSDVATDAARLQETWQAVQHAEARVTALYARWEHLEAKREGRALESNS